ncbi:MAG: FadR/GntR family transcriptional regulator [Candidatus Promineifilaceae bacterium]|jgi:GntR family transcriptional repressor for pyruvate dehydrogenase complex
MFHPVKRQSVAEETAERIIRLIRNEGYEPGDKLPSERQLGKDLKVGRTSVREAIRRLEAIGLLEVRQGIGTFVKDPGSRILQTTLIPHVVTDSDKLEELFETREIIEIAAASRAAQRADKHQIMEMRRWVQLIETYVARGDTQGITTADVEFHRQIIKATGNSTLLTLMDSLVDLLHDMRHDSSNIPELLPDIISGHRAILTAIEEGDSTAAGEAMKDHLDRVAARVKSFWHQQVKSTVGETT